uniref:Uncharacterized protein n=1 Tax=Nelumbo nucifera TaxID=4432 RepID=A0A822ZSQ1_NELNU|nr:TPA_asm: hypothetical protein HUJ06_017467 [Nelumbo nucifera]
MAVTQVAQRPEVCVSVSRERVTTSVLKETEVWFVFHIVEDYMKLVPTSTEGNVFREMDHPKYVEKEFLVDFADLLCPTRMESKVLYMLSCLGFLLPETCESLKPEITNFACCLVGGIEKMKAKTVNIFIYFNVTKFEVCGEDHRKENFCRRCHERVEGTSQLCKKPKLDVTLLPN